MLKTCTLESLIQVDPALLQFSVKQPDENMREAIKHTHARITTAVEGSPRIRAKIRKPA